MMFCASLFGILRRLYNMRPTEDFEDAMADLLRPIPRPDARSGR
jgi:hypothetical protein